MADVFISYAHEDASFVERLRAALEERRREVWSDRDIEPADRWRASADEAIDRSDAVLFVISVASLASEPCRGEIFYAAEINKRLIAVCVEEAAADVAHKPPDIAELSWIMMRPGDPFDAGVESVLRALDTDIAAVREHTRILVRARAWELGGRRTSPLLRGDELREAEDWLSRAASAGVRPTELHMQFIRASRSVATRRARTFVVVSLAVAVVAIALSIFALAERSDAIHQANVALSRQLSVEGANQSAYGARVAALLSIEGYARSPTPQARSALVGSIEQPLIATRYPGVGEVNGLAETLHGQTIAAGGAGGLAIWRSGDPGPVAVIRTGSVVNGVAFSPDGTLIAAALHDGFAIVYRVSDHAVVDRLRGDGSAVNAVAFGAAASGGPALAYVTERGDVFLRDLASGANSHTSVGDATLLSVAFNRAGSQLAVGGGSNSPNGAGALLIYRLGTSTAPQSIAVGSAVNSLDFAPSGSLLAAASDDGNLYLIDPSSGAKPREIAIGSPVDVARFNPAGTIVATGDAAGAVRLWNPSSGGQVGETMNAASIVYGLAFARGGSEVVSAGYDGTALSWEASGRSPLERAVATAARTGGIDEVAVNRAGTLIATANRNGSANVWNGASLAELRGLSGSPEAITTVAFAPSGDRLAVGLNGGGVAFVDAASDKAAGTLPAPRGERGPVNVVAFGPGGLVAVGEASGYVFIWSLAHRRVRLLHKLRRGAGSGVTALAFDPAADSLAVTFNDSGRIQVYSLGNRTWRPITVSEGIWSLAFADRGAELLAGDNQGAVELFDPGNGARIGTLPGAGQPVYGLAISPDGETVATTDGAGRLRFWDLAGQVELGQPITTGSSTFSLAFSGNGARLVTGDVDGTLAAFSPLFWSRDGAAVSRYLCPRVGRNLSAEQWSEDVPGQPYHATC